MNLKSHFSSVHGILQARIMEWVAIPFSRGSPSSWLELRSAALQADSHYPSHQGSSIEEERLPNCLAMAQTPYLECKGKMHE